MVKERLEVTLEPEDLNYLEKFGPRGKSKAVSQGLQLLKEKEMNGGSVETSEIKNIEVSL